MADQWKLPPIVIEQVFIPMTQLIDWGVKDFGVPALWPEFGTGKGVKVCVLDTGQPTHRDLIPALGAAKDFTGSIRGVKDMNGHSTHCCGIIGARNNEQDTVGVAPDCDLMCGKVLGDNGSGSSYGIVAGIAWAVQNGADVISMSLGSPFPDDQIKAAIDQIPPSVVLCCAAGNSGPGENTSEYPGSWDRALCVASIKQLRQVSTFSSRGQAVDVAAPGEKITSTWPGDQVATLSGTSMATPYVAGLAALVIGYLRKTGRPAITHGQFAALIEETADDAGPPGPDTAYGFGIVNPGALLAKVKLIPPITPEPPPPPQPVPQPPGATQIIVSGAALPAGKYNVTPT